MLCDVELQLFTCGVLYSCNYMCIVLYLYTYVIVYLLI